MTTIVWLKDDLRLHDNPAVLAALRTTPIENTLFIRSGRGDDALVCPTRRRIDAERAALDDMTEMVSSSGGMLVEIGSGCRDMMAQCMDHDATTVHANVQISDAFEYARDRQVAAALRASGIQYIEHVDDGIGRGSIPAPVPLITGARDIPGLRFSTVPPAMGRLTRYLDRLPYARYRRDMWTPGPDATASSRLSIDLACGMLSGDRVLHQIAKSRARSDPRSHHAYDQFENRIHWRRQFVQMLENGVKAFPWGPMRHQRPEDASRMSAWLEGKTGYPLVDAAMRSLAADGWINFRLRQMVSSFAIDLLDLDFHKVGVALGELFDDYSPGIHWYQIALQSGMVPGRGPRVLNPVKQAGELDAAGAYVRHVLPYMRDVPDGNVLEPWNWDGYQGPKPIVEHMSAARTARARHPATTK